MNTLKPENLESRLEEAEPQNQGESDAPVEDQAWTEEEVVSETIQIAEPKVEVSPAARKSSGASQH